MSRFGLRMTVEQVEAHQKRINARAAGRVEVQDGKKVVDLQPMKLSKYRNRPCVVDGQKFDSEKEARRWRELKLLEYAGAIRKLRRQVSFDLRVNRIPICRYMADFVYVKDKKTRIEDVKGYRKGIAYRMFQIKTALMCALHGYRVEEI